MVEDSPMQKIHWHTHELIVIDTYLIGVVGHPVNNTALLLAIDRLGIPGR